MSDVLFWIIFGPELVIIAGCFWGFLIVLAAYLVHDWIVARAWKRKLDRGQAHERAARR